MRSRNLERDCTNFKSPFMTVELEGKMKFRYDRRITGSQEIVCKNPLEWFN